MRSLKDGSWEGEKVRGKEKDEGRWMMDEDEGTRQKKMGREWQTKDEGRGMMDDGRRKRDDESLKDGSWDDGKVRR